jgi:signal transduction histidine kinase
MRPGRFLKRLINPESEEAVTDQIAEIASSEVIEEVSPVGEFDLANTTQEESTEREERVSVEPEAPADNRTIDQPDSEAADRLYATDEELRAAGIDPEQLGGNDAVADAGPDVASTEQGDSVKLEDNSPEREPDTPVSGVKPDAVPEQVDEQSLARSAVSAGFVITLATELRTPISSLRVSFDLLKDPEAVRSNPEESKRLIGNIERSIARLERQASDLLEVGYINTGSLTLIKQPINISEPILAAIDISRSTAALRQVAIELEIEPNLPRVVADGFRLTQIVTHLLSNAIKFTPVGESVVISMSTGTSGSPSSTAENQELVADAEADSIIVRVTDHGPGIRESHFERIFDPFYRITGEGIEGGAGVGLGLAIVKGLVELHSGKVWVHSTPGKVTEFGFSIPLTGRINDPG